MQAIISDIHANQEAIKTVLGDIEEQGADEIICLGDVIGYGPEPRECLDIAMDFDVAIQGNHEQALMVQMEGASFNVKARSSIDWTRAQLDMLQEDLREENRPRWDFLGELRETYERDDMFFVHGSPREPISEYIYPRDVHRPAKLEDIFSRINHLCFVGHTHMPGIWTEDMVYLTPHEVNYRYRLTSKKTIINVGSVGQPRDEDVRSSYVLLDDGTVIFRKVPYELEKTVEKIRNIPELDAFLAERLLQGR